MITRAAVTILRRMEIAVNSDALKVARQLEQQLHSELTLIKTSAENVVPPIRH